MTGPGSWRLEVMDVVKLGGDDSLVDSEGEGETERGEGVGEGKEREREGD